MVFVVVQKVGTFALERPHGYERSFATAGSGNCGKPARLVDAFEGCTRLQPLGGASAVQFEKDAMLRDENLAYE